ncbi:MAG: methyltransferase domain-containing protein [Bacteroidetes bacterium]|jgi:ubiquinone/menaquinone biosynthesis C-methylase UbiE|nr:methyltransferase domain-containing protein [Bacteroidota bacterium]
METKTQKYNYSSEWIKKIESPDHWRLYWSQANLTLKYTKPGDRILEIGVGSGFLANYLKSWGYNVTTIDIDKDKSPDITANIVEYDFNESYDFVLAFEVFEHIPFEEFEKIAKKLKKFCKKGIIVSVPRNEKPWLEITVQTILSPRKYPVRLTSVRNKLTTDHHFWEIDYKKHSKKKFENVFSKNGFKKLHHESYRATQFYMFENQSY